MSHLSKLKIVAQQQKRLQSKTEHRRAKLLEKLDYARSAICQLR